MHSTDLHDHPEWAEYTESEQECVWARVGAEGQCDPRRGRPGCRLVVGRTRAGVPGLAFIGRGPWRSWLAHLCSALLAALGTLLGDCAGQASRSAWATITKYKQLISTSHGSGGQKSERSGHQHGQIPMRAFCRLQTSGCVHTWWKELGSSSGSFLSGH